MGELQEKDFIQERYEKDPTPFWLWFFILAAFTLSLWFVEGWFLREIRTDYQKSPFLQVNNRDLSVFLWQFPEKMRINASRKASYLPAFQYEEKLSLFPDQADDWVAAPPQLLFMYHTWKRQIGDVWFSRPITRKEFIEFLNYAEEWKPQYWSGAPPRYVRMYENLEKGKNDADVSDELPLIVRQAFQGWKNFFKEGKDIEKVQPTEEEIERLIETYPLYARNYWRNLYPEYLTQSYPPFLKVALFNFKHSEK